MFTLGSWQPQIGDPSVVGWFTVVSYYVCAALCLVSALQGRVRSDKTDARFRILLTAIVTLLGITKQFNLPGGVTEVGRMVVNSIGGYDGRRAGQALLLGLMVIGVVAFIRRSRRNPRTRDLWRRRAPELLCLIYLCGLVILRAVSLHHVGALFAVEFFGVRVNWIVELSGIYALMVIVAVRIFGPRKRTH